MMLGERHHPPDPMVADSPWLHPDDDPDDCLHDIVAALQLYGRADYDGSDPGDETDEFRMYEFKVRKCGRGRAHDWTECPFAHPGEKARRRDPRVYHYSAAACAEFRKGGCRRGDSCEFSHGVFECWLHPAKYRTQPCKDRTRCTRRVCFFAHTPEQLRAVTPQHSPRSPKESPFRKMQPLLATPSTNSPDESPPISPLARSLGPGSSPMTEMILSLRNLQLDRVKMLPASYNISGSCYTSPRGSVPPPGFQSLPSTPTVGQAPPGFWECWETSSEDEPVMERVESGRSLRAKMLEKLRRENLLSPDEPDPYPDVGWVSELLK